MASAIQGKTQKVDRLRAFTATLARVSMSVSAIFNEFGFRWFQSQAESPQPLSKGFLNTKGIRAILETQHEVIDISHHAGLAPKT